MLLYAHSEANHGNHISDVMMVFSLFLDSLVIGTQCHLWRSTNSVMALKDILSHLQLSNNLCLMTWRRVCDCV